MQRLCLLLLTIVIGGCAVGGKEKHDSDIYREAMLLGIESSGDSQLQLVVVKDALK